MIRATLLILILGVAAIAFAAADDQAAMAPAASVAPFPQAAFGKVTYISVNDLPAAQRQVLMQQNLDESRAHTVVGIKYFPQGVAPANVDMMATLKSLAPRGQAPVASIPGASDLSKTPLANLQLVATMTSSRGAASAPNADVMRIFERMDGTTIMLDEWDYVNGGGGVLRIKEICNTDVNGTPASLVALIDSAGRTLWEIAWVTAKKSFTLYLTTPLDPDNAAALILALARSIP